MTTNAVLPEAEKALTVARMKADRFAQKVSALADAVQCAKVGRPIRVEAELGEMLFDLLASIARADALSEALVITGAVDSTLSEGLSARTQERLGRLRQIMNQLDREESDATRSELLDEAAGLADVCPSCAQEWAGYR